jgi:hypothetical protein
MGCFRPPPDARPPTRSSGRLKFSNAAPPSTLRAIGAVPAPAATAKRATLRRGGRRRPADGGRIALDGTCYQRYEGPLSGRAVPGIHLIETERRDEDFDHLEDMLYGAARRAGWITSTADPTLAAIPEIEIRVGITPTRG